MNIYYTLPLPLSFEESGVASTKNAKSLLFGRGLKAKRSRPKGVTDLGLRILDLNIFYKIENEKLKQILKQNYS
jgi:hypothetical protein